VLAIGCHKLDIHSLRKLRLALNLCGLCLPVTGELVHKDDIVWVAHHDGNSSECSRRHLHNHLGVDRRLAEFGFDVDTYDGAMKLQAHIRDLAGRTTDPATATAVVVGAGLTGIETASELADQGRTITLVCGGQLAPSLSKPGRKSIAKWFARHGVAVLEEDVVAEVRADAVVFADGAVRPSALTIWTAGFGVPDLAAASGLRTDALGRLLTDETLTSVDDERVVAAGDCAAPSGQPLRMSCQAAGPLGAQAANTVLSRIAGTEPAVADQAFVGSCISLGRRAATVQFARKDDSPVNFYLGGRLAAKVKEVICKGTLWGLRREAGKPGSTFIVKGGRHPVEQSAPEVVTNP